MQESFERTARAHRHKLIEQIGFTFGQELSHLLGSNALLENNFAALEVTTWRRLCMRGNRFAAHIVATVVVDRARTLGAVAQTRGVCELHNLAGVCVFVFAEIEFKFPVFLFFAELECDFCGERPTRFGAEAF